MAQPPRFCDQCGAESRPNARYCWSCGQLLQDPPSLQQTSDVAQAPKTVDIVICYAHEDEDLRDRLIKQLYVLHRQGLIALWHDRDISAGKEWVQEMDSHLKKAHIILLLISPDFIASDYCYSVEMQRAIERHENGEARVIPIILRPVHWQSTPLGKLQPLPADARPIMASNWGSLDEAFYNVAEGIRVVVEEFLGRSRSSRDLPTGNTEKSILTARESYNSAKTMLRSAKYSGKLFANYRLTRLLGAGGFAEVYLGQNIHSSAFAAIKIMEGPLLGEAAEEFLHQSQNIARLIHPHILRVLDIGLEEAIPFIVMDYASNGSLRERCPKGTQLPLSTITLYVNQIADALQYAHERRIIHGDLKPENLLLGPRNEVWVSDFSLDVDTITRADPLGVMTATIPYMAPEQFYHERRPAVDQYALGIIVYEWLCGNRPFSGSAFEVLTQHMVAGPPTLRDRVKISPSVEQVVMKALAKDPNRRFNSVRDFASALERAATVGA